MNLGEELLPILAILVVLLSMSAVDIIIIGEPLRVLSTLPMLLIIFLWTVATFKVRRKQNVR